MRGSRRNTHGFVRASEGVLTERPELGGTKNDRLLTFFEMLEPSSAERLRHILNKGGQPAPWLMEECANALEIEPAYFVEWRVREANRLYDVREVGIDRALANFAEWARSAAS